MTRRSMLISGGTLLGLAVVLGILVVTLEAGATDGLDLFWNEAMVPLRQPWILAGAYAMNRIGGGWIAVLVVPVLVAAVLIMLRRWRAAVYAAVAFAGSAVLTQLVKQIFGRARPEDMLVASDFGSYPSGHTSNAATIAVVLWLVFPRVWMAVIGALWVLAMALSRTILSVHWITDTVGGALVGASAALLVAAMLAGWVSLGWTGQPIASPRRPRAEDPPVP